MAHAIILDTYEYAKALKKANVPDVQIEAEIARDKERTKAINEAIDDNLATKHDISLIQKDIKILDVKIESIKNNTKTILWLIGSVAFIFTSTQLLKIFGFQL